MRTLQIEEVGLLFFVSECWPVLQSMSLWPQDHIYDYRCPADLTAVLAAGECNAIPPAPPCVVVACDTCSSAPYQKFGVTTGGVANGLSASNGMKMLNTITSARLGASLGRPCTPAAPSVADRIRRRNQPVEFVPSLVMYRR